MANLFPRYVPVSDHAVLVEFADQITEGATRQILSLDRALSAAPPDGLREVVPALVNLLVEFDPLTTDHAAIIHAVKQRLAQMADHRLSRRAHEVAVCYDAPFGQDLEDVAQQTGLSRDEVINRHLGATYHVGMYGFAPGYAYLTGVDPQIQIPRKPTALRDVPAGSVIIAGAQCLVTTLTMPTGWCIIGRSPTAILRDDPDRPFLFDVGDQILFKRVDQAGFDRLSQEVGHG